MTMKSSQRKRIACQTPVAYFIYNRPDKTVRSFESIRRARPARLFIIADGPKDAADYRKVEQTRRVVDSINWPCEVTRIYAETNMGCALRVSSGISEVFSMVDRSMILEDDIVASDGFFEFQERMLERYKDDERVMMVTGWNSFVDYPIDGYDGFFSKSSAIWGWGTWRRAWAPYRLDPLAEDGQASIRIKKQLASYMDDPFWVEYHQHLVDVRIWETFDTWDLQWALLVYSSMGFSVTPTRNLSLNIGFDEEGTNTTSRHAARFIPWTLPSDQAAWTGRILESRTPETTWHDRARLLFHLLIMQKDLRVLYLYHKHPGMLPTGPERKGWDLYLGVFRHSNVCLEILDHLGKHLGHAAFDDYREVFKRVRA